MAGHAFLSPSGAPAWTRCLAKPYLERGLPDSSSRDADEGTAAHVLRAMCLTDGLVTADYRGAVIDVAGTSFVVTDEMSEAVQRSVDVLRAFSGEMFVEVQLDISSITGEEGATGTADAVILDHAARTIIVDDYKHGRGVAVSSEENEQAMIYAGAALAEFDLLCDWEWVVIRISQPRINNDSEWRISADELRKRLWAIRKVAAEIMAGDEITLPATPGETQCRWCKAKATCPALRAEVAQTIGISAASVDEFMDEEINQPSGACGETWLSACMDKIDLIESWCKAIRAETERRLLAGAEVPGWKLVEGRRGARKWQDESTVEEVLKGMRLKVEEMYDLSLISPTTAEKLHKAGRIGPRRWPKVLELITQSEGKPSVAPATDKRPALNVAVAFDDLTEDDLA